MPKARMNVLGAWVFIIGVLLAVVVALLELGQPWPIVLVILGILIGILNISESELKDFMMAGTVLVIVSYFGGQGLFELQVAGLNIGAIFNTLIVLFVPAVIVAALREVLTLGRR